MGFLSIDHSGYDANPGHKHGLMEFDTAQCIHCQKVIVVVKRGCNTFACSGDTYLEAQHAHEFSESYVHHYRCRKCDGNICRDCAREMARKGECPGPFIARLEARLGKGRLDELNYRYRPLVLGASLGTQV
jgi:ribosomal protein S14